MLLNESRARGDFYTATIKLGEIVQDYKNQVGHLARILNSMTVRIDKSEIAMAVQNSLPPTFEYIVTVLDNVEDDETLSFGSP